MRDAVLLWTPKVAGKSLIQAFNIKKFLSAEDIRHVHGIVTFKHLDYRALVNAGYVSKGFDASAFKFGFVRNPYDRAVSLWRYFVHQKLWDGDFVGFLKEVAKGVPPVGLSDPDGWVICNPQWRWVAGADFLGRYETLQADFDKLKTVLGAPTATLPWVNASRRGPYGRDYDDEALRLVNRLYKDDFEAFDYPVYTQTHGGFVRQSEVDYWDAEAKGRAGRDNFHKRQEIVRRLLGLPLFRARVLEIGVGAGHAFATVQVALGGNLSYRGTELSPTWAEYAKNNFHMEVVQTDVTSLPAEAGSADFVVALDTLEHVRPEDRDQGYGEIDRVLRPGGKVVLNIPCAESLHDLDFDYGFDRADWVRLMHVTGAEEVCYEEYSVDMPGGPRTYIWAIAEKPKPTEKILLLSPWENAWVPLYTQVFKEKGYDVYRDTEKPDVVLHMWAYGTDPAEYPGAVNIVFMRRFELWEDHWRNLDPAKIDAMVFCNEGIRQAVIAKWGDKCPPTHLVYNVPDPARWTYKDRGPGEKIGMACHVHAKKNLPLALQILGALPDSYELHVAGGIQDPCLADYLAHQTEAMGRVLYLYGHVSAKDMDAWWEDKNYCLSTSISEGNPNNVIEAMCKGIKPVVHEWPGAKDQFPKECLFKTVDRAVEVINGPYDSKKYREHVAEEYSLDNFRRVVTLTEELIEKRRKK